MSPGELRKAFLLSAFCLLIFSCKGHGPTLQRMADQPKYDPLEASDFFADGQSARPRIPGTVARGEIANDGFMSTGKINGVDADGFPFPITEQVMNRGEERFNIYCSPCHSKVGDGNGMVPSRGYRHPPSFHTDTLRAAKTSHFFDVMTNGFGAMPPYAAQVNVRDRWAIVAYIRALQLSQHATVADLPPDAQAKLSGAGGAQ
jgi:mono/diheme cytochrome c family protein